MVAVAGPNTRAQYGVIKQTTTVALQLSFLHRLEEND